MTDERNGTAEQLAEAEYLVLRMERVAESMSDAASRMERAASEMNSAASRMGEAAGAMYMAGRR